MVIQINSKTYGTQELIIDNKDFSFVKLYTWRLLKAKHGFHAVTNILIRKNTYKTILLHRLIMGVDDERVVDHKDGNGLNNHRNNLRICSISDNNKNMRTSRRNKSGYKGVFFYKYWGKYIAYITANGKRINLGHFETKEDAANAYNEAAKKYHGEFAKINAL